MLFPTTSKIKIKILISASQANPSRHSPRKCQYRGRIQRHNIVHNLHRGSRPRGVIGLSIAAPLIIAQRKHLPRNLFCQHRRHALWSSSRYRCMYMCFVYRLVVVNWKFMIIIPNFLPNCTFICSVCARKSFPLNSQPTVSIDEP